MALQSPPINNVDRDKKVKYVLTYVKSLCSFNFVDPTNDVESERICSDSCDDTINDAAHVSAGICDNDISYDIITICNDAIHNIVRLCRHRSSSQTAQHQEG